MQCFINVKNLDFENANVLVLWSQTIWQITFCLKHALRFCEQPIYNGIKEIGKNAHTPLKLSTTGQKTLLTFLLANLLLKLFTTIKLILQLVTRQNTNGINTCDF